MIVEVFGGFQLPEVRKKLVTIFIFLDLVLLCV